jgi:glycosyltransferase involved in cell wall biosynthesis
MADPTPHVAFIATPDLSYVSGSSLSLRYTVEQLAEFGARCTVLCQRAPTGPLHPGVEYRELPMPLDYQIITDTRPSDDDLFTCGRMLASELISIPDVNVVHAIYGTFTGLAGLWGAALKQIPLVVSTFGRDVTFGAAADGRYHRMMTMSYGHASLVFASDSGVAQAVSERYAGLRTEVRVVPPGINFPLVRKYARRQDGAAGRRLLAVQSSFNPKKGLSHLIDAVAVLSRDLPDVELVIVGHDDTPDQRIEARLREQASKLGIETRIQYAGHLDHVEVLQLIPDFDVLVDPRTINSFSTCVYEAMALGVPIVASDVSCNREALGDGERGVLVPPGEPEALAAGLRRVLTDATLAERIRSAAVHHSLQAEHELGTSSVAAALLAGYQSIWSAS